MVHFTIDNPIKWEEKVASQVLKNITWPTSYWGMTLQKCRVNACVMLVLAYNSYQQHKCDPIDESYSSPIWRVKINQEVISVLLNKKIILKIIRKNIKIIQNLRTPRITKIKLNQIKKKNYVVKRGKVLCQCYHCLFCRLQQAKLLGFFGLWSLRTWATQTMLDFVLCGENSDWCVYNAPRT